MGGDGCSVRASRQGRRCVRAVAVDRAVGPAAEHGADEALGLAVGLGPVGAGAEVADAERAAGDRVDGRAVGRAVVGDQPLDGDAVAAVERDGAAQERRSRWWPSRRRGPRRRPGGWRRRSRRARTPSRVASTACRRVGVGVVAAGGLPVTRWPAPPCDPAELLDVDVDQLAGPLRARSARRAPGRAGRACPSRSASGSPRPSTAPSPATSAISAPVIRSRRSAAITCDALLVGAIGDRAAAPRSDPAARARPRRDSGRPTCARVRSLTSAASAAFVSDHPARRTRSTQHAAACSG